MTNERRLTKADFEDLEQGLFMFRMAARVEPEMTVSAKMLAAGPVEALRILAEELQLLGDEVREMTVSAQKQVAFNKNVVAMLTRIAEAAGTDLDND